MGRHLRIPDASEITDDTPLLLDVAARVAFPDGSVSGLALRNAAGRDELEYERIAGRLYTTLAAIREMRAACRRKPKVQGSGSSAATSAPTESGSLARGPSKTMEESGSAQASALLALESRLRQLKRPSPNTSSGNEKPPAKSTVVPMRSRLRT
jgi:hypothetical protein